MHAEQSSTTDQPQYTALCLKAAKDPSVFQNFRNNPIYVGVVESVNDHQGKEYLDFIYQKAPHFIPYFDRFKTSDQIGGPLTYPYNGIGSFSPTTLRYIKIAAELEMLFGSLEGLSIIEIGGGYGGQCKIISDLFKFKNYTIVDLPGPLLLTQKYLSTQGVKNVNLATPNMYIENSEFDIVISNYAFSECTFEMQKKYIENILSKSKKGYLICNLVVESPHKTAALIPRSEGLFATKEKLLNELTHANLAWEEAAEMPSTAPTNYLLTWGATPVDENLLNFEELAADPYTDHLRSFRELFQLEKIDSFLEFGLGKSTQYFLENCKKVVSVELTVENKLKQIEPWYKKSLELFKNYRNWSPSIHYLSPAFDLAEKRACLSLDPAIFDASYLTEIDQLCNGIFQNQSFDLAFVDPGIHIRGDLVNALFDKVDIIVAHDTACTRHKMFGFYRSKHLIIT